MTRYQNLFNHVHSSVTQNYVIKTMNVQNMSSRNDGLTFDSMLDEVFMMYHKEMLIMQSKSMDAMKEKFRNLLNVAIEKDYLDIVSVVGTSFTYEAKEKGLSLSLDKILSADIFCNRLARAVKLFTDLSMTKLDGALIRQDKNSTISTVGSENLRGSILSSMKEDELPQESLEGHDTAVNIQMDGSKRKMRSSDKNELLGIVKMEPKSGDEDGPDTTPSRRASSNNTSSSSSTNVTNRSPKSRNSEVEKQAQQCIEDQTLLADESTSSRAKMEARGS